MKGGTLDARSRLTPLLGTAMAGVAAGCLLLFAVFARQAILDVNAGLSVLPDAPSTAIRQAITLLTPFQAARPEPPLDEGVSATPAVALPPASESPDGDVVAPPADDFAGPPGGERDDAGRGELGDLPLGERAPTGVNRNDSDEWWLDHHGGGHGHANVKARGHEKAKGHQKKSKTKPSRADNPGRGHQKTGPPPRAEKSHPAAAGHGRGDGKPHPKAERKHTAHGKQHGHGNGRGKGHGGPPKGRGRH